MRMVKEVIETLINTTALTLTSFGVTQIVGGSWHGYISISFGMFLEFAKYKGRKMKLWR